MKEKPILFSGEMIRAIMNGSKTQTRRIIKDALNHQNGYIIKSDNGTLTLGCGLSSLRWSNGSI